MRMGERVLLIAIVSLCVPAFAYDWSTNPGDGSPENPYQISTPEQLMSTGSIPTIPEQHFILMNDIVFDPNNNPAHVFTQSIIVPGGAPGFAGSFDGHSYAIRNLKITSSAPYLGLFGTTTDAVIKNVRLENVCIVSTNSQYGMVGGLIGQMLRTRVENCTVSGHITGVKVVGGLVGCGFLSYWSYPQGQVEIPGGVIHNCSSTATVTGQSDVGGLAGSFAGKISRCASSARVQGVGSSGWLGGLIGGQGYSSSADENIMVQCFCAAKLYGADNTMYAGGLAGFIAVPVYDCYSDAEIIVGNNSHYIGGFAAAMQAGPLGPFAVARYCYSTANVNAGAGSTSIGIFTPGGSLDYFYFTNSAGNKFPLTDAQMKQQASFTGWDFVGESVNRQNEIWRMCVDGVDYPRLSWEFAERRFRLRRRGGFGGFECIGGSVAVGLPDRRDDFQLCL